MYKATNIDTDKALEAIEDMHCDKMKERERERYALNKYYEGIDKGLELAKGIFCCSNYEKEKSETAHIKIQYNNREYTVAEICERMAELEDALKEKDKTK